MKYTRSASFAQILKRWVETHWNVTLRGNVSWWVVANNPDEGDSHEVWWSLGAFTCLSKATHRITLDPLGLVRNSMCRTELLQCTGELKKQQPKKPLKWHREENWSGGRESLQRRWRLQGQWRQRGESKRLDTVELVLLSNTFRSPCCSDSFTADLTRTIIRSLVDWVSSFHFISPWDTLPRSSWRTLVQTVVW